MIRTLGEWVIGATGVAATQIVTADSLGPTMIATVHERVRREAIAGQVVSERPGNARLIAAAPRMQTWLIAAREALEHGDEAMRAATIKHIDELLAEIARPV